jgi:hypothetical protein
MSEQAGTRLVAAGTFLRRYRRCDKLITLHRPAGGEGTSDLGRAPSCAFSINLFGSSSNAAEDIRRLSVLESCKATTTMITTVVKRPRDLSVHAHHSSASILAQL